MPKLVFVPDDLVPVLQELALDLIKALKHSNKDPDRLQMILSTNMQVLLTSIRNHKNEFTSPLELLVSVIRTAAAQIEATGTIFDDRQINTEETLRLMKECHTDVVIPPQYINVVAEDDPKGESIGMNQVCGGHDTMEEAIKCAEMNRTQMVHLAKKLKAEKNHTIHYYIIKRDSTIVEDVSLKPPGERVRGAAT